MTADLDDPIARVPLLIAVLGLIGSGVAWKIGGLPYGTAFLIGALGAYFNFRLIERLVGRLLRTLEAKPGKRPKLAGFSLIIQLALYLAGAFVILRVSGFNVVVALCGFFVCPAAVMLEAIYQLITNYGHS